MNNMKRPSKIKRVSYYDMNLNKICVANCGKSRRKLHGYVIYGNLLQIMKTLTALKCKFIVLSLIKQSLLVSGITFQMLVEILFCETFQ